MANWQDTKSGLVTSMSKRHQESISTWGGTRHIRPIRRWLRTIGKNWTLAMRWIWPRECSLPPSVVGTNSISLRSRITVMVIPKSCFDWMKSEFRLDKDGRNTTHWPSHPLWLCRKGKQSILYCGVDQFTAATGRNSREFYWKKIWSFHNLPPKLNWNDFPRPINCNNDFDCRIIIRLFH